MKTDDFWSSGAVILWNSDHEEGHQDSKEEKSDCHKKCDMIAVDEILERICASSWDDNRSGNAGEDRESERSAHLLRCIDETWDESSFMRWYTRGRCGHRRHDREPDTDRHDDECGQEIQEIIPVYRRPSQEEKSKCDRQRSADEERFEAILWDVFRHSRSDETEDQREGDKGETGRERRVVKDFLEVECEEEKRCEHGGIDRNHDKIGSCDIANAENREREEWMFYQEFVRDKSRKENDGSYEHEDNWCTRPSPRRCLTDRKYKEHEADGHQQSTFYIEFCIRLFALMERHELPDQVGHHDSYRDIDEKIPSPSQILREKTAQKHPKRCTTGGHECPITQGFIPIFSIAEEDEDDWKCGRRHKCRGESLKCTERDELDRGCWYTDGKRENRKHDHTEEKNLPTTKEVSCTTPEQEKSTETQRVGRDDPLERTRCEMEICLYRRQGDIGDRAIEDDHKLGDGHEHEYEPRRFFCHDRGG